MPTPIQIEAERLLAEERKKRKQFVVIYKTGAYLVAAVGTVLTGSLAGIFAAPIVETVGNLLSGASQYEKELQEVVDGKRDALPPKPPEDDGGSAHFA
jgi:hypothetical protein